MWGWRYSRCVVMEGRDVVMEGTRRMHFEV